MSWEEESDSKPPGPRLGYLCLFRLKGEIVNCPECGRFMALKVSMDIAEDPWESWLWYTCDGEEGYLHDPLALPAPLYQWLWNCQGIPREHLEDNPELRAEYATMWAELPNSHKGPYRKEVAAALNQQED